MKCPFFVPCPHEQAGTDYTTCLPDYHPLTDYQLGVVLDFAKRNRNDGVALAHAQVRICKALPGYVCPRME